MRDLSIHDKEFLIECIVKGEALPDDYREKLFPTTQKEYELRYAGKMRKEDLLADEDGTFAVPLQVEKLYNGERKQYKDGWKNIIAFGDNLQFLKTLYKNEDPIIKNKVKGKVKLIYIDPPFGTSSDFSGKQGQKGYTDKAKDADFIELIRRRLILAKELLSEDGSIYVHLDWKKSHYIKLVLDEIFGESHFKNEIIWQRRQGNLAQSKQYGASTDSILFYTKSDDYYFKVPMKMEGAEDYVEERFKYTDQNGRRYRLSPIISPSYSKSLVYEYKGYHPPRNGWSCSQETMEKWDNEGKLVFPKKQTQRIQRKQYLDEWEGRPVQNLWSDIPPVNPQAIERIDYPTQKPEQLLERIITASTQENDIVLDFFSGSGTTAAVAEKLNRRWIICDIGKYSFYTMQKRMLTIQNSRSLLHPSKSFNQLAKTFITVNIGVYDLKKMQQLNQDKYIEFVLQLFEVTPKSRTIKGIKVHGERKDGYSVLVWDYWNYKDSGIDINFLDQLHQSIGKRIGKRFYIIAPANAVQFISDFYEIEDVRYYFLKIPYQIIKELHPRSFAKFRQPQSKNKLNDLDNAIGFHFMLQPEVESVYENNKLLIKRFVSSFREEETENTLANFESLSMIILDQNFNGKDFIMTDCFFKDDIEFVDNALQLTLTNPGTSIFIVYIDIYGNEFKEEIKIR